MKIYAHPKLGYKCFENANRSTGSYLLCSDLKTKERRYVTYIYDGYFEGHYLVQSPSKAAANPLNQERALYLSNNNSDDYTIDRMWPKAIYCQKKKKYVVTGRGYVS